MQLPDDESREQRDAADEPVARISGSEKPRCGASISAKTGPPSPSTQSTPADDVDARASPVVSRPGIAIRISTSVAITNGTLIRKIERHDPTETSQPPTSGPIRNEIPVQAVQVPIAAPRSSPVKVDGDRRERGRREQRAGDALQPARDDQRRARSARRRRGPR